MKNSTRINRKHLRYFTEIARRIRRSQPAGRLMHAMPVRRRAAVSDNVLDGPRSVLTQQAGNRMWTPMALLHHLLIR